MYGLIAPIEQEPTVVFKGKDMHMRAQAARPPVQKEDAHCSATHQSHSTAGV